MKKDLIVAFDLHSNNSMCGIINQKGEQIKSSKLFNDMHHVTSFLSPYRDRIEAAIVESTYNWYWLVDGLSELGFEVHLANPAQIEQYRGLKHADDRSDAFFLANLYRLNILPTGFICANPHRSMRDLFRRRAMLVRKRTSVLLSMNSLHSRNEGTGLGGDWFKNASADDVLEVFSDPHDQMVADGEKYVVNCLSEVIEKLETTAIKWASALPGYARIKAIPGVGKILATTVALEVVDIDRFARAENFASYCRTVKASRYTNEKQKGLNNSKSGNPHLAWAFIEAANFIRRYDPAARSWYDRKARRTHRVVALKAMACKLAKVVWYMMKNNEPYDSARVFGGSHQAATKPGKQNFGSASASQNKGLKKKSKD